MEIKRLVDGQDIIDVVNSSKEYPTKSRMYDRSSCRGYDAATFRLAVRDWWDGLWENSPYRSDSCKLPEHLITRKAYLADRRAKKVTVKKYKPRKIEQKSNGTPKVKPARRSRTAIAQKGGFTLADLMMDQLCICPNCGSDLIASMNYELDHIQPVSKGGSDEFWNLQFLCKPCNISKRDKDPFIWSAQTGTPVPEKFLARFK